MKFTSQTNNYTQLGTQPVSGSFLLSSGPVNDYDAVNKVYIDNIFKNKQNFYRFTEQYTTGADLTIADTAYNSIYPITPFSITYPLSSIPTLIWRQLNTVEYQPFSTPIVTLQNVTGYTQAPYLLISLSGTYDIEAAASIELNPAAVNGSTHAVSLIALSAVNTGPVYITETLTSTNQTSWIVPTGITSVSAFVVGGGGNGGNSLGAGGGGGGISLGVYTIPANTTSIQYTVGAASQNSIFGNILAYGGTSGLSGTQTTYTRGGSGTLFVGGSGGGSSLSGTNGYLYNGVYYSVGGAGSNVTTGSAVNQGGGKGGTSKLAATKATTYGSGGGGGGSLKNAKAGGGGNQGIIIVSYSVPPLSTNTLANGSVSWVGDSASSHVSGRFKFSGPTGIALVQTQCTYYKQDNVKNSVLLGATQFISSAANPLSFVNTAWINVQKIC